MADHPTPNLRLVDLHRRRAMLAIGSPVTYELGRGGFAHLNPHVDWDQGKCDCSGFVSWVLETQRAPKAGRDFWIESTAVYGDALIKQRVFRALPGPIPGCVVVYPDHKHPHHEGHMGIVADSRPKAYDVIDMTHAGIRLHTGEVFRRHGAIFCTLADDFSRR